MQEGPVQIQWKEGEAIQVKKKLECPMVDKSFSELIEEIKRNKQWGMMSIERNRNSGFLLISWDWSIDKKKNEN